VYRALTACPREKVIRAAVPDRLRRPVSLPQQRAQSVAQGEPRLGEALLAPALQFGAPPLAEEFPARVVAPAIDPPQTRAR
jgi:hypothetical protein